MSVRDRCWVHVLWCDDIRNEVGNKPSFMGVYTQGLVVPSLPTVLPRLAVFAQIHIPEKKVAKVLRTRIERSDGMVLAETELNVDAADAPQPEAVDPGLSPTEATLPRVRSLPTAFILGGIELTADTTHLRLFLEVDAEVIPSFRLRISTAASPPQKDTNEQ